MESQIQWIMYVWMYVLIHTRHLKLLPSKKYAETVLAVKEEDAEACRLIEEVSKTILYHSLSGRQPDSNSYDGTINGYHNIQMWNEI